MRQDALDCNYTTGVKVFEKKNELNLPKLIKYYVHQELRIDKFLKTFLVDLLQNLFCWHVTHDKESQGIYFLLLCFADD